ARRLALLLPVVPLLMAPGARAAEPPDRTVVLFLIDRVSFENLLSIPPVRGLAAAGGAGLMSSRTPLRDLLTSADLSGVRIVDLGSIEGTSGEPSPDSLRRAKLGITAALRAGPGRELVIVATPSPSSAMERAKDDLTGVVVARGSAAALAAIAAAPPPNGSSLTTLTSDSTRRSGVVASVDVTATIEAFLGRGAPDAAVIRADPGPAPLALHERYLADRRMSVPVQVGAGIYAAVVGLLCVGLLALGARAPARTRRMGALGALSVLPIGLALLLAGHIPLLSYATVVPSVIVVSALGTAAGARFGRARGSAAAAGVLGTAVLAALALEAALGWPAALTPFLGGSELDGGRFYGLPNVDIGLLVGAAMYVAAWIGVPFAGAVVLVLAGLFAGLPWTGSNLGGAVTLFAGAGLWYSIRRSGRLGLRETGVGLVSAGAGTFAILAAHRYLAPFPTHITHFVEGESGTVLGRAAERLRVGVDLIVRNPFALVPVLGVPACLWAVLRPPRPLRSALERQPVWRETILAILVTSVVAFVANDSGAAALGLGFGAGLGALLHVSLTEATGKM
ncbi:MAG: hypothetical protein HY240_05630, partial [Actinobacteria bacterium]|nr:hypothetical protein [Actinomycetota bacterium]